MKTIPVMADDSLGDSWDLTQTGGPRIEIRHSGATEVATYSRGLPTPGFHS